MDTQTQSQTQDSRTFKIFWKDQIRRFSGPDHLPWEEFLRQLRAILGPDFHQELRIQYVDDESDKIDLTTQMEWEQCLTILPPGGLVKLYITPGSGIYFKDSAPPQPQYWYEETNGVKKETVQPTQVLQELSQVLPEVLGQCWDGNKILPYHIPDWLRPAINVKNTQTPNEVELDVDVNGLFHALFDKAMSLMHSNKYSFAREFWLKALAVKGPKQATVLYNLACTENLLGNKRAALNYLKEAFDAGFGKVEHARTDPDLLSLHSHPEFEAILLSASPQPVPVVVKTEVKEEEPMQVEPEAPAPVPVAVPAVVVPTPTVEVEVPMVQAPEVPAPVPVPVSVPATVPAPVPMAAVPTPQLQGFDLQVANLRSMGFQLDDDLLVSLLVAYDGDISKVVSHLVAHSL